MAGFVLLLLLGSFGATVRVHARAPALQPTPAHHVREMPTVGGWQITIISRNGAPGLTGATLQAVRGQRRIEVPLDGTPTGRTARGVDDVRLHEASGRLLVLTDQAYDAPGMILVDLPSARVVDAVTGRGMVLSPDARLVAFEEFYSRLDAPWPWNETVYAVYDVAARPEDMRRACPYQDDRCRGHLVYLPSRQEVCAARLEHTGDASCLEPGREPQHQRRSPFVWTDMQTLAFVTVDLVRERSSLVLASFGAPGSPPRVETFRCDPAAANPQGSCPPARTSWHADLIKRDDDGRRVWVHFRDRLPERPSGWLVVGGS